MTLPFAQNTFGAVTCGLGMHHLDVVTALREMHRVLRAGAKLVLITVGAPPSWRSWWAGPLLKMAIFLGFAVSNKSARALAEVDALPNVHTPEEWLEILAAAGYSDLHTSVPFRGRRSWYPDSLMIIAEKGDGARDDY
jgi:ubiquinone/menaquinone biosynthesis C-methylase UbiE